MCGEVIYNNSFTSAHMPSLNWQCPQGRLCNHFTVNEIFFVQNLCAEWSGKKSGSIRIAFGIKSLTLDSALVASTTRTTATNKTVLPVNHIE